MLTQKVVKRVQDCWPGDGEHDSALGHLDHRGRPRSRGLFLDFVVEKPLPKRQTVKVSWKTIDGNIVAKCKANKLKKMKGKKTSSKSSQKR